jgi:CMP-N,N'-diacetyllegionaminic acid synthase
VIKKSARVAIIPARGGSKGIPRKNLQLLGGYPLIAWAIRAAQRAQVFERIVVSTDDLEIASVATAYGAEVPFIRPREISQDYSLQLNTLVHALEHFEETGQNISSVTLLQPTSPFRFGSDCQNALGLFEEFGENTVVSVTDFSHVQPSNLYGGELNDLLSNLKSEDKGTLRQSFPKTWWRNGSIYIFSPFTLLNGRKLYTEKTLGYQMPSWQSHNIDNLNDLEDAEMAIFDPRISELRSSLFLE